MGNSRLQEDVKSQDNLSPPPGDSIRGAGVLLQMHGLRILADFEGFASIAKLPGHVSEAKQVCGPGASKGGGAKPIKSANIRRPASAYTHTPPFIFACIS